LQFASSAFLVRISMERVPHLAPAARAGFIRRDLVRLNAFPVNRASTVSTTLASTAQRAPIKARQANRIALAAMQASTPLESDLLMRSIVPVAQTILIKGKSGCLCAVRVQLENIQITHAAMIRLLVSLAAGTSAFIAMRLSRNAR
jgi:hypothetical protein